MLEDVIECRDAVRVPDDKRMKRHAQRPCRFLPLPRTVDRKRPLPSRPICRPDSRDTPITRTSLISVEYGTGDQPAFANFDRHGLIVRHHVDRVFDAELRQQIEKRLGRADCRSKPPCNVVGRYAA